MDSMDRMANTSNSCEGVERFCDRCKRSEKGFELFYHQGYYCRDCKSALPGDAKRTAENVALRECLKIYVEESERSCDQECATHRQEPSICAACKEGSLLTRAKALLSEKDEPVKACATCGIPFGSNGCPSITGYKVDLCWQPKP